MKRSTRYAPGGQHVDALMVSLAVVGILSGCTDDSSTVAGEATATLECQSRGFPCTWAEVAAEVFERTEELAHQAHERFEMGVSPTEVAHWLEAMDDMGDVHSDEYSTRFWVEGGRPVWVFTPEAERLGLRSAPLPTPPQQADPVGPQDEGDKPRKALLFIDPYRWEFGLDTRVDKYDDEAERILTIFDQVRDYKCQPGKECRCPGDNCVEYVGNVWAGGCDPATNGCRIASGVTLEHFKNWELSDVIHIASHGTESCTRDGKACAGAIATGRLIRGSLKEYAELLYAFDSPLSQLPPGSEWLTEPGVELVGPLSMTHCVLLDEGTTASESAYCEVPSESPLGETVWREYLGADFFRSVYGPGKLRDKLIFLNSCVSMRYGVLAGVLAGDGGANAVMGWTEWTDNKQASIAAAAFYREWVKGKTAEEAFLAVKNDPAFAGLGAAFAGGGQMHRGEEPESAVAAPGELRRRGGPKRGVEIVAIRLPGTGDELADGGALRVIGVAEDAKPDRLEVVLEVRGIPADERPSEYPLRLRVGDRQVSDVVTANRPQGDGVHRYEGDLKLGFDVPLDAREDLELRVELPGGGMSRWLYEDIALSAYPCEFTATVSAGPGAGQHAGTAHLLGSGLMLRDADGEWKALIELPGKDPGRYETAMTVQVLVPHPYQPDMMAWAWADAPEGSQAQPATVIVERTEGDVGIGRADGFIEGRVEGRGGWRSDGGDTYFDLSAQFKAVPFAVSPRSPWQLCREAWGLTSSGDLLKRLQP